MDGFLPDFPELGQGLDVSATSCFRRVELQEHLSLLPCYIGRLGEGIIEHLNAKVMRYCNHYGGVLLSYSKPTVLQRIGRIFDEQPHIHFDVRFNAYIFKPLVGSVLCGTVNKIGHSGNHLGCLVYECFNASVTAGKVRTATGSKNGWIQNFQLGAKVWFKVTTLDVVGGILSVRGEHVDFNDYLVDSTDKGDLTLPVKDSKKAKKRKRHHSSSKHDGTQRKKHCKDEGQSDAVLTKDSQRHRKKMEDSSRKHKPHKHKH